MELTMTNGFSELSFSEMEATDGGGFWKDLKKGGAALLGTVAIAAAPIVGTCVALGVTAGSLGTLAPAGVGAGFLAAGALATTGAGLLEYACD